MEPMMIFVRTNTLSNELHYDGELVLTYKLEYPEFGGTAYPAALPSINNFYLKKALEYERYIEKELYPLAVEQYKESIEHGYPVRVFEVIQIYKMTYKRFCVLSLYMDRYEYTGGAHGITVRLSQTWNLQRGRMVKLEDLYRCGSDYKQEILRQVILQIQQNPEFYFEDYEVLVDQNFNAQNFYCTYAGIVVYYQLYEIAPYSSGIREFLIPYGGCFVNPRDGCTLY